MPKRDDLAITRQRRVILEELGSVSSHPTADEVHAMVRRRLPRISLGTVYRNLEILSERGLIQRLHTGGAQMRFDGNPERHCHVRCTRCGRVGDISTQPIGNLADAVSESSGYEVTGYHLEFAGVCPDCAGSECESEKESG